MLSSVLAAGILSNLSLATPPCTGSLLRNITESYIDAQSNGAYWRLHSIAANLTYTEQFVEKDIVRGILASPLKITHSHSFHDDTSCATFTEIIVTDSEHLYVIGTRITSDGIQIQTIDTLITDEGDWLFNATGYAYFNSKEDWYPISEDNRDSRSVIKAAGDAYFDNFVNDSVTVPYAPSCARLEGGLYTDPHLSGGNTCNQGIPNGTEIVNRRYVIGQEMGIVNIFVGFTGLDRASPDPAPDSHLFRVEGGRIRYIHTLSTCEGHPGCGWNSSLPVGTE